MSRIHNPLRIHIGPGGVMVDKYGRTFEHDEQLFKRRRKNSVLPAYHAAKLQQPTQVQHAPLPVNGTTFEHRAGWYVHPDTNGQQRRMM